MLTLENRINEINCRVTVTVRRLGGGYGGKISRPAQIAAACAIAAHKLGKPVRHVMSLRTNMEAMGKRPPYVHTYKVCFYELQKINLISPIISNKWTPRESTFAVMSN
jgi:xanthine dehydrogenase molybdopterin-binding subunit B